MPKLTIATLATSNPMGQQAYEAAVLSRAAAALGPSWAVSGTTIGSLRSPTPGAVRIPARLLNRGSGLQRHLAGLLVYPQRALVHRMDLRLPPAAHEVVTIHDVVSWRFPDEGMGPPRTAGAEARRAAAVVCPSAFSANEIATTLGVDNPIVIHNGVEQIFRDATPLDDAELARLGVTRPFVLHAGGCSLRKNLGALAGAWELIHNARPEVSLVLVGPQDRRRDALFAARAGTRILGRVEGALVPGLMATADVVVVPSLYEGFGLPALEAMAAGTPVVAANRSSLPEVCAAAAVLVEPTARGLADGVLDVLGSDSSELRSRGRARAADFSWERNAAEHAQIWRSVR